MKAPDNQDRKNPGFEECLEKARHFCAFQDRSKRQVLQKLTRLGAEEEWKEQLIALLEEEDFINEKRYQEVFIRGKARIKGWGPEKIKQKLYQELGRPPDKELKAKAEDNVAAEQKLKKALEKKWQTLRQKKDPQWKARLLRFCISRGFDAETAFRLIAGLEKGS